MRRVSLREANQKFSSCIAEVESGESLVLVRRGKPVARIVPYAEHEERDLKHEAAVHELEGFLKKGIDLGGVRVDRDELYSRGR
ncbi:type II toxin-antitoxin system Phd/YefM family antitoxin [Edaphobacter aggregans]|uniref:type II toxin-antitoxin system Phd/YefM family antitoxin n=1 Tax=Edaphobacter aggregans TaxID=570835 RepID=UPI000558015A|nr:type II toxin-antitoxin system prevent-host-death family antitoxin [Edaphobacter aggregans]